MRSPVLIGAIMAVAFVAMAWAADTGSRADADALQQKLFQIATNGLAEKPVKRNTPVSERELNAYLQAHAQESLPAGVVDPSVTILPDGRLTGQATVDLDAVRTSKERSMLSPWTLLRGRLPVEATGILRTGNGVGAFTLESASVGGVPVPKSVLEELVSFYSKHPDQADGVNFEAPFRLPARIREIQTTLGRALVVQ